MSDLRSEMEKVIPSLNHSVLDEWHQEELQREGAVSWEQAVTKTQALYLAVKAHPGISTGDLVKLLKGRVGEGSLSALLRQLNDAQFLRFEGQTPKRQWFATSKVRIEPKLTAHQQEILAKAQEARRAQVLEDREKRAAKEARAVKKAAKQKTQDQIRLPAAPRADIFLPPDMAKLLGAKAKLTPAELVETMDVRTAKAVYEELKGLFG